jgi:hypothetical protein
MNSQPTPREGPALRGRETRSWLSPLLALTMTLAVGCETAPPKPCDPAESHDSTSPSSGAPAVIVRESPIFSGPEAGAQQLGIRAAGTPVRVVRTAGSRALVIEHGDPRLASYVDLAHLEIARDDFERFFRPPPAATVIAFSPPAMDAFTEDADRIVREALIAYMGSFLAPRAQSLEVLWSSGFGTGATTLRLVVPAMPECPPNDLGPKPDDPFSVERRDWDARYAQYLNKLTAFNKAKEENQAQVTSLVEELRQLPRPARAQSGLSLAQLARAVAPATAPNVHLVLAVNPSVEPAPAAAGLDLRGRHVSLVSQCSGDPLTCDQAARDWTSRIASAGALSVRWVDVTSPALRQAFDPASPRLR